MFHRVMNAASGGPAAPARHHKGRLVGRRHSPNNGTDTMLGCYVNVKSADETLDLTTDESYTLVTKSPYCEINAQTVFGALRALETLAQLVERNMSIGLYSVEDRPRFHYRGSMIDTSRHYYPLNVIYQHLDAMSYAKQNVLHWHIVDDQSFPYVSTAFPEMSRQGAFSPRHVYTVQDIQKVQRYAYDRGIRVIPEFDSPGHVTRGYEALNPPILTDCYSVPPGSTVPVKTGTGPVNPTLNATYDFMTRLFGEVKDVFWDKFVHLGGDEVIKHCWMSNPQIQEWMKRNPHIKTGDDLQQYYIDRLLQIVKAQGSSYIVWQEIFDDGQKILPDTVVEVWKDVNDVGNKSWADSLASVTAAGYHSILASPFYLNYISYGADWKKYYQVEPSNFTGGEAAEAKGLLSGVEWCMWSEYVDAANFIPRSWPRAAAVAERAWSPKEVRSIEDAQIRLHEYRCKLLERGIPAEPIENGANIKVLGGKTFCPNEWNPRYSPPWI